MSERTNLRPRVKNFRSVTILFANLVAVSIVVAVLGERFFATIRFAGVSLPRFPSESNPLLSILLSPFTHVLIVLIAAFIGAGFTSVYIRGPIRRIEQWLADWQAGRDVNPLKLRSGDDVYQNIVRMMNDLGERSRKSR